MIRVDKRDFLTDIFMLIISVGGVLTYIAEREILLFISVFFVWLNIVFYSLRNIGDRAALFSFEITNFVFLIGGSFFSYVLYNKPLFEFNHSILIHTYVMIFISQILIYVCYRILSMKKRVRESHQKSVWTNKNVLLRIRKFSLVLIIISAIPSLIITLDNVRYASAYSYEELYLRSGNGYSFIINKLAQLFIISVFIYLATMPPKKKALFPMGIFLGIRAVSLFTGRRTDFMLAVMVLFFYYVYRNKANPEENWIGKAEIILIIVVAPLLIVLLVNVSNIRSGSALSINLLDSIMSFFKEQGVSITVIEYGKELQGIIPKQPYLFGPIIDWFKENEITRIFYQFTDYGSQTAMQALKGAAFGDTISYLVIPTGYSMGRGLGSCYIAEAYQTLSVFGVVFVNIIFGLVLRFIDENYGTSVIGSSFLLFMLMRILYAPRSTSFSFISSTFTITNIAVICLMAFACKHVKFKRRISRKNLCHE